MDIETLASKVGASIRATREAQGLSGAELARRARIGAHVLWRYEVGQMVPGLRNLVAIADALKVPVGRLLPPPSKAA